MAIIIFMYNYLKMIRHAGLDPSSSCINFKDLDSTIKSWNDAVIDGYYSAYASNSCALIRRSWTLTPLGHLTTHSEQSLQRIFRISLGRLQKPSRAS